MAGSVFSGVVDAGQFRPDDPVRFSGRLARLNGRRVRVTVQRETPGRTMSQNRFYWGVVLATLSEWSGHEPEELHEHFKQWLEPVEREMPGGHRMIVHPSTTSLTVEQFSAYVDKIVRWAAEQGVNVPSPEEINV